MDKFTKLQKKKDDIISDELWKGDYFSVKKYKDWDVVVQSDSVVILPYFKDTAQVMLRYEYIPTYNFVQKNKEYFVTSISGEIKNGESILNAIKREVYEEGGIVLSNFYNITIEGPFFVNKGITTRYYTCILDLEYNDFKQVIPPTDGSRAEKLSKSVKVDLSDLNNIIIDDIYTQFLVNKLNSEYIKINT